METNIYKLAQLARQNCGIALLPETAAEEYEKSGQLVQLLQDWKAAHGLFHAVYPIRRGILPAVRVFIAYSVEHLSEPP